MELGIYNVRKRYQNDMVLDIDELIIEKGIITGITGPNGSGKTTLLNIIGGLEDKYEGRVTYGGEVYSEDIKLKTTLVFQKPYLFRRSVFDNIAYPLNLRKVDRATIQEKVREIGELLSINDLMNKKGHQLSGGESQKVAMARAMVMEPDLLLLDEPTASLDPESVIKIEKSLSEYQKQKGCTVVIITHNIEQSRRLCHKVVCLERGKVVLNGIL
ncbi:MAG: ATP-binding cassette domain-containing protein [Bacillota bacterium]